MSHRPLVRGPDRVIVRPDTLVGRCHDTKMRLLVVSQASVKIVERRFDHADCFEHRLELLFRCRGTSGWGHGIISRTVIPQMLMRFLRRLLQGCELCALIFA